MTPKKEKIFLIKVGQNRKALRSASPGLVQDTGWQFFDKDYRRGTGGYVRISPFKTRRSAEAAIAREKRLLSEEREQFDADMRFLGTPIGKAMAKRHPRLRSFLIQDTNPNAFMKDIAFEVVECDKENFDSLFE